MSSNQPNSPGEAGESMATERFPWMTDVALDGVSTGADEVPNVVLVTLDCLRYDRCGFNGADKDTTPALDELASESLLFDRALAPGPRTAESVPGLLAGRLSADCAYLGELYYKAIPGDAETLATWLGDAGYRTVATLSNPQLSRSRNFDRGFDAFTNLRIENGTGESGAAGGDDGSRDTESLVRRVGRRALAVSETLPLPVDPAVIGTVGFRFRQLYGEWPSVAGSDVIDRFVEELPEPSRGPFFAWTHLNDIHSPVHPGRVQQGGLFEASAWTQFKADARRIRQQRSPVYETMYDSVVRYVDEQVGRLLATLRKRDDWDRTVVVVTADHGEALWDRGVYGHAAGHEQRIHDEDRDYLYRELTHVPLLVRLPNPSPSGRIATPFSLLWLHELIRLATDLPSGGFPRESTQSTSSRPVPGQVVVPTDSVTHGGHTVAVRRGDETLLTDGTTPETLTPENWYYFRGTDRGERYTNHDPPQDLVAHCERLVTDPSSVPEVGGRVSADTERLLQSLGYR